MATAATTPDRLVLADLVPGSLARDAALIVGGAGLTGLAAQVSIHTPLMLAAGIIEFVGGVLILLGLFTHIAGFVASGEMAVAYFMMHAGKGFFPIQNGGELAVVYCFLFLFIACRGAGKFAVDKS